MNRVLASPSLRPGDRLGLDQLLVDRLGLGRLAQEHVQLGAQAQEIDRVARVRAGAVDAGVDRLALVALFHQLVDRHERVALVQRAQRCGRAGGRR